MHLAHAAGSFAVALSSESNLRQSEALRGSPALEIRTGFRSPRRRSARDDRVLSLLLLSVREGRQT